MQFRWISIGSIGCFSLFFLCFFLFFSRFRKPKKTEKRKTIVKKFRKKSKQNPFFEFFQKRLFFLFPTILQEFSCNFPGNFPYCFRSFEKVEKRKKWFLSNEKKIVGRFSSVSFVKKECKTFWIWWSNKNVIYNTKLKSIFKKMVFKNFIQILSQKYQK